MNSPLLNGINPADLFVSDPIAIILGQRLNDIKVSLDDAHKALSRNYSPANVDKFLQVAIAHVKAAKDILPFLKSAIPEKIANLQKEAPQKKKETKDHERTRNNPSPAEEKPI